MMAIHGTWDPAFTPVVERFREVVTTAHGGSALAVVRPNATLVDVWTGVADPVTGRPWTHETPAIVFSCSKAVMAALAACAVDDGLLDYDAPVSDFWREFAVGGKESARVSDILSHRVGLPTVDGRLQPEDVFDRDRIVRRLAEQVPSWSPGSAHAYHALTYGWMLGFVLERVTGQRLESLVRDLSRSRLADPMWLAFPADLTAFRARLAGPLSSDELQNDADAAVARWIDGDVTAIDAPSILATGIPGAGIVTTARSLAQLAASMVDGEDPLFSTPVRDRATLEWTAGPSILGEPPPWARWGMGFQLDSQWRRLLGPRSFGHDGYGGQLMVADPDSGIGLAFVTTDLRLEQDHRADALVACVRAVCASGG